jgi:hypothetical protein
MGVRVVLADLVNPENALRHDPRKLAASLMRVYYDRAQAPAVRPPEISSVGA